MENTDLLLKVAFGNLVKGSVIYFQHGQQKYCTFWRGTLW